MNILLPALLFALHLQVSDTSDNQMACAPEKAMLYADKKSYDETPIWEGTQENGNKLIITQSPTGTWSLFVGSRDGDLCFVVDGEPVKNE